MALLLTWHIYHNFCCSGNMFLWNLGAEIQAHKSNYSVMFVKPWQNREILYVAVQKYLAIWCLTVALVYMLWCHHIINILKVITNTSDKQWQNQLCIKVKQWQWFYKIVSIQMYATVDICNITVNIGLPCAPFTYVGVCPKCVYCNQPLEDTRVFA